MCAPNPPAPPNYAEAAREQGQANIDAARLTGQLNNPNVYNPYGTQTISFQGDQPTVRQEFSPEQQRLYEQSTEVRRLLGGLGEQGATALYDILGKNLDFSSLPSAPGGASDTRDRVVNNTMARVDTDLGQQREAKQSELIAAGLRPGTEAYEREMTRIDRTRTDALQQAQLAGGQEASRDFGLDAERRRTAIAELLAQRQTPLNEVTALMSGSQVSNPFAGGLGYQGGATVGAAPVFGAAQAQEQAAQDAYNTRAGAWGNMMSGLFRLGGAAIGASDRRLKRDIRRIGTHRLGIGLYEWTYVWGERARGVMADEVETVLPEAVLTINGYKAVNYAMLGT